MRKAGALSAVAALALLAGCGTRSEPPQPREDPASPAPPTQLSAPVGASPEPSESVSPDPEESPLPTPTADPKAPLARYAPADECAALPGFPAFRDKLLAAAKARDAEALAALAEPGIRLDFGGGAGLDQLKQRLSAKDAPLWGEVEALAGLGCAADKGLATLPWIFSRVPEDADASSTMLVTGAKIPLRVKASAKSPVVRELDWALVTLTGSSFNPEADFAEVATSAGTRGFVETARLRSLLDYRLIADRQSGEWKIAALVAGD